MQTYSEHSGYSAHIPGKLMGLVDTRPMSCKDEILVYIIQYNMS